MKNLKPQIVMPTLSSLWPQGVGALPGLLIPVLLLTPRGVTAELRPAWETCFALPVQYACTPYLAFGIS